MQSEIKKLPKSEVEIRIEVSVEELKPFLEKAAQKISQEIKIEGFRPGKASYEIVKSKVGEAAILEEALDAIVSKNYFTVLKEKEITTVAQPKIDVEKMAPGNPLIFKATVAVLPKVKLGDYQKIELKRPEAKVKDEEISKVIEDIRKMRATEKIIEREAKIGDRLEIDFEVFLDKVVIENGQHNQYPITIGENRFIPGFEDQLVGLKAGDQKEFALAFPENYHQKTLAGRTCDFKVKCNAVYEVELANVNDEFAASISGGEIKTVNELKENISKNIEQEEKNKAEQKLETEIIEKIINISEFEELSESLIEGEAHKMVHEIEDKVVGQGLKFEDYLKSIKKSHDDLESELRPEAEKRVKAALVSREIFTAEKLEITEEEIKKEIEAILVGYPDNPEVKNQLASEAYQDYLRNAMASRKVMDYLKSIMVK